MTNSTAQQLKAAYLVNLFLMAIESQIENIVYLVMILIFVCSPSLISVVLPLSILFYAILENPIPAKRYWKWMTRYVITVLVLKIVIQLPLFCSTPAFALCNC